MSETREEAFRREKEALITSLNSYKCEDDESVVGGISKVKSQAKVVSESMHFVQQRAAGIFNYQKTEYSKLNRALGGGIEPNTILSVAALSSGGKTTLGTRICNSICKIPTNKPALVLNFNFEMVAHKIVGREICNLGNFNLQHLYNGDRDMTDKELQRILDYYYSEVMTYPVLYVEEPANYLNIGKTIYYYWRKFCKGKNITLIVQIDHALIVTGAKETDKEKDKVDGLMRELNTIKKKIANEGGEAIYIVLSQLNRDIQDKDRKTNSMLHYPQTSDLFGASSIEQYSDYILFTHNPSKLNLTSYTEFNYPVWMGEGENARGRPFIYWSVAKNRDGQLFDCIPMVSKFENFNFEELNFEEFGVYHREFLNTGNCFRKTEKELQDAIEAHRLKSNAK